MRHCSCAAARAPLLRCRCWRAAAGAPRSEKRCRESLPLPLPLPRSSAAAAAETRYTQKLCRSSGRPRSARSNLRSALSWDRVARAPSFSRAQVVRCPQRRARASRRGRSSAVAPARCGHSGTRAPSRRSSGCRATCSSSSPSCSKRHAAELRGPARVLYRNLDPVPGLTD
jgi:hypothetical protein